MTSHTKKMHLRCHLCQQEKPLIDAHILPKNYYEVGTDLRSYNVRKGCRNASSKGLYDRQILCAKCDNQFSKLDEMSYQHFLVEPVRYADEMTQFGARVSLPNLDMNRFIYSVLWRSSISRQELVRGVSLGNKHEKRLLELSLASNAFDPFEYPILIRYFPDLPVDKPVVFPHKARHQASGTNYYMAYFGRYVAHIKIDSRPNSGLFSNEFVLGYNGSMTIIVDKYQGSDVQKANLLTFNQTKKQEGTNYGYFNT